MNNAEPRKIEAKLTSSTTVELTKWLGLKTEYMASNHVEVKAFLAEKGIEADNTAYRFTSGWRRDKTNFLRRAQLRAESRLQERAVRNFTASIERRTAYWRTIQETVMLKLGILNPTESGATDPKIKPFDLLMLTQALEIAVKGERLEAGQPTVVERIDQVNTHTLRMEEIGDNDFDEMEREMTIAIPYELDPADSLPSSDEGGGTDQVVPPPSVS